MFLLSSQVELSPCLSSSSPAYVLASWEWFLVISWAAISLLACTDTDLAMG